MRKLFSREIKAFQGTVWNFYRLRGRKMPWRHEKDPFKILVSEIMLQQTQVERVRQKYEEFLETFPSLALLAKAPLSKVLRVWQGLGYNRRAQFLHRSAKEVVSQYNGSIPRDFEQLQTLPGIGKATAGSVSAFAFNLPVAFIETNIRRVYIHHFFPQGKAVLDKDILSLVEQTLDQGNPREWYYALMDYGASLKENNPNRKSAHYKKQAKFKGSNREVRGSIVKYLAEHKKLSLLDGGAMLGFAPERFAEAYKSLLREGCIREKQGKITLQA